MAKNSIKTKPLSVQIADTVKLQACRIIDKMDKAYQPIAAKLEGLAVGIFELAVVASKLGKGVPEYTQAYFKEMCKAAETHYKEAQGIDNVKDRLPCWAVFKSEINRAIDCGLSPASFDSYSAFKEARKAFERKQEEKELEQQQAKGRESEQMRTGQRAGTEGLSAGVESGRLSPKLTAVLNILPKACAGMDEETQDAFAEELASLVAKYGDKLKGEQQEQPRQTRRQRRAEKQEQKQEQPTAETPPAGSVAA